MGIFSKIWKGVKRGFKSIGKGIKSMAKKVGKFMDKIGIVGQIALSFILPGVGTLLSKGVSFLAGQGGIMGSIGKILQTAGKFGSTVGNAFKSVTDGIGSFVKNVGGGMLNNLGKAVGMDGKLISSAPKTVSEGFQKWMSGVRDSSADIMSPWRKAAEETTSSINHTFDESFDFPLEDTDIGFPDRGVTPQALGEERDWTFPSFQENQVGTEMTQEGMEQAKNSWLDYATGVATQAVDTLKELPGAVIDTAAEGVTDGIKQQALNAVGLGPETPEYNTYVTNVPEFNSATPDTTYAQQGFQYGGIPQQALEYYSATNSPQYGAFGSQAYNNFSQMRGGFNA